MSDSSKLPSFFQFQGKTVVDGLIEFELGGELEDDNTGLEEEEPVDHEIEFTEADINGTTMIQALDIDIEKYLVAKIADADQKMSPRMDSTTSSNSEGTAGKANALLNMLKGASKSSEVDENPIPAMQQINVGPMQNFGPMPPFPPGFPGYNGPHPFPPGFPGYGPMPFPPHFMPPPGSFPMPPPGAFPMPMHPGNMPPMPVPGNAHPPGPHPMGAWSRPPPFIPPPQPMPFPPPPMLHPPLQHHNKINPNDFLRRLPSGSMMRPEDVSYVVRRVLDPMQSADPFADDYYHIQYKIKKNNMLRDEFMQNQETSTPPPLLYIPLPTWKDTKDRLRQQINDARKVSQDKSRKWEEREKVLGHNSKADFTRPKEVLSVPTLNEVYNLDDEATGIEGSMRIPYGSRLWNMRQAVQRGYQALYTVQELQYLLDTPTVADSSFNREEVAADIRKAISGLAQSLGIRTVDDDMVNHGEITLEGGLVAAILQTAKGKRLLSRSFEILPPDFRWALLPAILARILQVNPAEQAEEDKQVEEKLMKNLLDFIRHAHQFQRELQSKADEQFLDGGESSAKFSYLLLGNLRQCLKSVMVTFIDKAQLRQALLSSRSRAEVMHIVVQVGDRVAEDVDAIAGSEWVQIRETFMLMLDT